MQDNVARLIWGATGETMLHTSGIIMMVVAGVLILSLNREKAYLVFIMAALMIPLTQKIVFLNLNFTSLRILIAVAWIRMFFRMELHPMRLNIIDKLFVLWVVSNAVTFVLLWQTWGAFVNRLGTLMDSAGLFFIFRFFISDIDEIDSGIRSLAILSIVLAVIMLVEQAAGTTMYAYMSGTPDVQFMREGRLRAQGPFAHSILAGTFGATLIPLLVSQWLKPGFSKVLVVTAMGACVVIALASVSSGPVLAAVWGVAAIFMWPLRMHMRFIRWSIAFFLLLAHLMMKAPVWALIDRVGFFAGSSSYHRFYLVDAFINRFDEWWLLGTKSTDHWGWMMWDAINQFVAEGVRGGLLSLVLFIALLAHCFRSIGLKVQETEGNRLAQLRYWAIGCALFTHMVSFLGIAYFDQMMVSWYFLLAMVSALDGIPVPVFQKPEVDIYRATPQFEGAGEGGLWTYR
ncbi:MAG: hypothetical protein ABFD62_02495 [Syntrophaceae bacterium]